MPRSLFLRERICATQKARQPKLFNFGTSCALYTRIQTGSNQIFKLQIFAHWRRRDLCELRVYFRSALLLNNTYYILLAAQSVPFGGYVLLKY